MVEKYVKGLQHWIVGSLHWSFDTERYFGKNGLEVKTTRRVVLLPKREKPLSGDTAPAAAAAVTDEENLEPAGIKEQAVDVEDTPALPDNSKEHSKSKSKVHLTLDHNEAPEVEVEAAPSRRPTGKSGEKFA